MFPTRVGDVFASKGGSDPGNPLETTRCHPRAGDDQHPASQQDRRGFGHLCMGGVFPSAASQLASPRPGDAR